MLAYLKLGKNVDQTWWYEFLVFGKMPPEDNTSSTPSGHEGSAAKTPDGVLPPEGGGNSSGERNGNSGRVVMPPTAPKGKPRAPPLIHGKIKPSEAGYY